MRGCVEESPLVKAQRALQAAAKRFAAKTLTSFDADEEVLVLEGAAVAYAAELPRPRKAAKK